MNQRKAKLLRTVVRLTDGPAVAYQEQKHKAKLFPTGATKEDGTPAVVSITMSTISLHPSCQRYAYQQLKKGA